MNREQPTMDKLKTLIDDVITECSVRGNNWSEFAFEVFAHIEEYTIPQYGDKGLDQVTGWIVEDCLKAVKKYASRYGTNQRPGQQKLDFLKMAHFIQLACEKFEELPVEKPHHIYIAMEEGSFATCSNCYDIVNVGDNFCSNCGVKFYEYYNELENNKIVK